ncbi:MAG: FUSC family protein, partial [Deltaproteobacteria bacterium]|nr:FUSC family protein [Deltaproteobacteria bacterium]
MVLQRINDRLWGTLLGVVLGLSVLFLAGDMRFVLIALCFALVTLTTYLSLEYRSHLLLWRWTALTIMLMVVIGLSYNYDAYFMTNLSRLWSILVGISVSWVFHVVFFPLASAIGIFFTLRKITGLLRAVSTETDTTGQVAALAGFYVNMEALHHLLASHALEKYGTITRAGQARHVLEALEAVGEQVIMARGKAQGFVTSILDTLDTINPLAVISLPTAGTQLGVLCAESPADTPVKLIRAAERMGRELLAMDMSTAKKAVPAASAPLRAYFFDSWYDDTFTNGYKAVIVGIGTAVGLWLWSEVAWPGGLFMVLLVMILGQFTAFTHNLPLKALVVLVILSLLITNLLMIFVIPLFDSTAGFFVWLFLLHLFFCWFAFSANKTLAFASLTLLLMLNLFINGYSATPYAMQLTLTYSWGV